MKLSMRNTALVLSLQLGCQLVASPTQTIFIAAKNGIHSAQLDLKTGALTNLQVAAQVENPQFLAIEPQQEFLFAVNNGTVVGRKTGVVSSFAIDAAAGKLSFINHQPALGLGPTHLDVDATSRTVLVANYGGGSVVSFPVAKTGRISPSFSRIQHQGSGPDTQRQQAPHAHCINVTPGNRFALACDLGADKVFVYRLDSATSALTTNDPPSASLKPGAGPRHLAFRPDGKFVYVINELDSTVTTFAFDSKQGSLKEVQTLSTLPKDFEGKNFTAEIAVHPNGKFLYGSNRGHDSIAVFSIDEKTGALTSIHHQPTGGQTPRHFEIEPTGKFLLAANQRSGSIHVFKIDPATGKLTATGNTLEIEGPSCVKSLSGGTK